MSEPAPSCRVRALAAGALAAAVLLWLALPRAADARVFLRWRLAAHGADVARSLGGRTAYAADMRLNGGEARVAVYGFAQGMAEVMAAVRRAYAGAQLAWSGGTLAQALLLDGGRALRLLVLRLEAQGQTLLIEVEQSDAEYRLSLEPPDPAEVERVLPLPPGAAPVFFARDANAGTSFAVAGAGLSPAGARAWYASRLGAEGWAVSFPVPADGGGLDFYTRGGAVLCVLSEAGAAPEGCRITVLHKHARTE